MNEKEVVLSLPSIVFGIVAVHGLRGQARAPKHRVVFEALRGPDQRETYMRKGWAFIELGW